MTDAESYHALARKARAEADATSLENVRERHLASAAAWSKMAAGAERFAALKSQSEAEKAARPPYPSRSRAVAD